MGATNIGLGESVLTIMGLLFGVLLFGKRLTVYSKTTKYKTQHIAAALAALLVTTQFTAAARIADVTVPSNERTNVVTGLGLVYGLKGSGDGGDFLPAIRMLAAALTKFDNPAVVLDLKAVKNVALVSLTATIPATGAREGDPIDVYVSSIGSASSLRGGRLFVCSDTDHCAGLQGAGRQGENLWTGTRGAYSYAEMFGHWAAEKRWFVNRAAPDVSTDRKRSF